MTISTLAPSGSDDTAAIQNALDVAGVTQLVLTAGTFLVSGVINPSSNQRITGYAGSTTIQVHADFSANVFVYDDKTGVVFEDLIFTVLNGSCNPLVFRTTDAEVHNCQITGGNYGIYAATPYNETTFLPTEEHSLKVTGCTLESQTTHGLLCDRGTTVEIFDTDAANQGSNGILLRGGSDATIARCTADGTGSDGISLLQTTDFSVVDCTCTDCGRWSILAGGGHFVWAVFENKPPVVAQFTIARNNCQRGGAANAGGGGISCDPNQTDPNTGETWTGIEDQEDSVIADNVCNLGDRHGIYTTRASNITFVGNTCTNNGTYGMTMRGKNCTLVKNTISGTVLEEDLRLTGRSLSELEYDDEGDHYVYDNTYGSLLDEAPLDSTFVDND